MLGLLEGHSAAKMLGEKESLTSWQIFSGLFVTFWITTAYFDHFLMTAVFCIVFGVVGEIITKEMYGDSADKKKKKNEKELEEIDDKSIQEKRENNEAIWLKAEAALEAEADEDETPPPLPDKDYETGRLDTLSAKLQALVDASEQEDGSRTPENNDDFGTSAPREYNRTVSDEYNQNTSTLNSNLIEDIAISQSIIEEESDEQKNFADKHESSGPKFYAPDSSDDDEEDDDDDYASREVNFDDSESEDEDFDQYQKNTSQENISQDAGATIPEEKEDESPMKTKVNGQVGFPSGVGKESERNMETVIQKEE